MSGGDRNDGRGRPRRRPAERSGRGPRAPRVEISPARLVAYDVLRDVEDRDAYANLALPSRIREARLDGRDAGLATELAAGALRGRGRYDRIIELAAGRSSEQIDSRTLNVLRLGAHQLLGMRTAAHAAVNESVELQRRVANANAAGFVNGVLRAIGRSSNEEWDRRIGEEARTPDEALAARSSHPAWVLRALRDALRSEGREHELEALLEADNAPPRVSLAVLPGAGVDAEGAAATAREAGLSADGASPLGVELAGGDPVRAVAAIDAREGLVRVQDQGSQLAALALTRSRPVVPGERWLDLCAGPGGKTAVLGAEALLGGASLRANEVSEHRAELVRRAVAGVAGAVEVVSHDGREASAYGDRSSVYDRILVDAPCSGLGALRRRPEARWRKQPSDLPVLTALQGELLDAAVERLAPGGMLAYVTCSPHLAETRVVVDRLLQRHSGLRELDARRVLRGIARAELDLAGDSPSAQLWPHRHGTDAMFIALLERGS
ncbi:RsmB/NOP family class I SAM-dependent RNA methyltransferase [Leucobacter triazinivorans]|uniref:rRNA small subunit methyltransferase B n=1 Tax=Leucobacter triazinivorans TaxID=1784719 RepID=A0A4P6KHC8_9MICO|nr:rRNA small subunit methyltransferase B [Leucobacter triazinivorans]